MIPPESRWPTGDMPRELRSAIADEAAALGLVMPTGVGAPEVHERVGGEGRRPFDAAALEKERAGVIIADPLDNSAVEGDALIRRLRRTAGEPTAPASATPPAVRAQAVLPTQYQNNPAPSMEYSLPLGGDRRAVVMLWGENIGPADLKLLGRYLKLAAGALDKPAGGINGSTSTASVPKHDPHGQDEELPAKRRALRGRVR